MTFAHQLKHFFHLTAITLAGLLAMAVSLRAADAPTDAPAAPPPPPPPPAGGTWYIFSPPKDGVVLSPPMREKLLTAIKTILDRSNPEQFAYVKKSENPFYPKIVPPPAPTAATPGTAPSLVTPIPQLSPADRLQQLADQLKPSGALIGGGSRLIFLASGDTLAGGQTIQVTFPGDSGPTVVILQEVLPDSFTLKMGDTVKTFPYVAKESVAHSNSSTTPSQPKP